MTKQGFPRLSATKGVRHLARAEPGKTQEVPVRAAQRHSLSQKKGGTKGGNKRAMALGQKAGVRHLARATAPTHLSKLKIVRRRSSKAPCVVEGGKQKFVFEATPTVKCVQ